MTKEEIKKLEYKLRDYYQNDIKIEGIEREIDLLKEHIKNIDNRIKNIDIDITEGATNNTGYLTQNWGEKVQTSSDGTSHMEREMIRLIDNLEYEKVNKMFRIERLELSKQKIKEESIGIEIYINMLEPHQKEFLKYRYGDKIGNINIAMNLNISTATLSREKKKILKMFEPLLH
ncbi:hypothetical protein [Clostridium perfringens]|uniref:hypothetical protein n=1 Tax=Clostridium perfringens TaxID=1502 RepID=UPI002442AB69|nr:hypothetical protein [Clostridium perfringens]EHK2389713.1 hypothetical protein [Clostridium perfringens]MDG6890886.1 hypothetical protein [Clostridium perfringens]MDK0680822.1 hypothetical protein [Clostridium perfringens]MDM0591451.1 hypothetical protein [Clostridium perfringens]MDM0600582.1 hypothetical protein [Clostridium perfringens]